MPVDNKDPQAKDANDVRLMLLSLCDTSGVLIQCHMSKFPDSYQVRHIPPPKKFDVHSYHQEVIQLALSVFQTSIDEEKEAFIQLKIYHKRSDGSHVWASLATMANSPETWRLLRRHKSGSEIIEIGVFLNPDNTPVSTKQVNMEDDVEGAMKYNGKPVAMQFFIAKNHQGSLWDSRDLIQETPGSYMARV